MLLRPLRVPAGCALIALIALMAVGLVVPPATAASACDGMTSPVYERINPSTAGAHLTTSQSGSTSMINDGFTVDAGVPFDAATSSHAGLVRVYRLSRSGGYVYTRSTFEVTTFMRRGYRNEGTAFFALGAPSSCAVPVYRYLLGTKYRMAVSQADQDALARAGAQFQGAAFYVSPDHVVSPPPGTAADRFSIAVYPDTQQEVLSLDDTRYLERAQYLVSQRAELDLRFMASTGDNANWDTPDHDQYKVLDAGVRPIEVAGIPYSLAIGNHDSNATGVGGSARPGLNIHDEQRRTTTFNLFFTAARFGAVQGAFEADKVDNIWSAFEANGKKWMVLSLELWPRESVVAWARTVVATHPDHNVIISTHSYLNSDGSISMSNGGYGDTAPIYLYDEVVKRYANVKIVLAGHTGQTFTRTDTGVHGNKVLTYLTALHSHTTNPIRFLEIDTKSGAVRTWVFGPRGKVTFPAASGTQSGLVWVG